ncbi:hypothetical protein K32_41040 [Kaistia sp. 32K]|nr:hypothetical protein K32_41040 [Kaistia sp. 32K]
MRSPVGCLRGGVGKRVEKRDGAGRYGLRRVEGPEACEPAAKLVRMALIRRDRRRAAAELGAKFPWGKWGPSPFLTSGRRRKRRMAEEGARGEAPLGPVATVQACRG